MTGERRSKGVISFRRLVAHEWRMLVRERAFALLAPLLALLMAGSVYCGAGWVRQRQATIDEIRAHDARLHARVLAQLQHLARRGDPWPDLPVNGMAWYVLQDEVHPPPAPYLDPRRPEAAGSEWGAARHAWLPVDPLAALAIGQGDLLPAWTRVTIRARPSLLNNDDVENPVTLLNGRFDPAFVLIVCWPLIALPLAYDVISREREAGTLRLALSQPVSIRRLVLAKLLVRAGALIAITLAAALAALAALVATGVLQFGEAGAPMAAGDPLPRLLLWCALVIANGLLWFGAAVAVNAAGWRSAMNALALAGLWLAWVVVLPGAANLIVTAVLPAPSRMALMTGLREATDAVTADAPRLVDAWYRAHPDVAPPTQTADRNAVRAAMIVDEAERRAQPLIDEVAERVRAQQMLAGRLRYASPSMLLQEALNDLAGSSTARHERFMTQVDAHQREWRAFFHPRIFQRVRLTAADYERLPRFAFAPEPSADVLARVARAIGLVSLIAGACLTGGLWALRRFSGVP